MPNESKKYGRNFLQDTLNIRKVMLTLTSNIVGVCNEFLHNCNKRYVDLLLSVLEAADLSFQCCKCVHMGNKN